MSSYYMGGVCGMGMAPLAAFLKADGNDVAGFDDCPNADVLEYLSRNGVRVGARMQRLDAFDAVVVSTALKRRLADIEKCGAKKIMLRGECWAQLCACRRLVAVAGSHGKSTVSALCAHAANKYAPEAGWLVGAIPAGFEMHKHCAEGGILFSEIDESDGTIENFSPEITVAVNADLDHTDTYADWDAVEQMFRRLFARTRRTVIFPESDKILAKVAAEFPQKARAVKTPAAFNEANKTLARAAFECALQTRLPADAFEDFGGLKRRQETLFCNSRAVAVADYAHHPSEVAAFLDYFCAEYPDAEKTIVFQPHRYSRTKSFADKFAEILDAKSGEAKILLAEVYAASEPFDAAGTSERIAEKSQNKTIIPAKNGEIFGYIDGLMSDNKSGKKQAIAFVGAGDLYFEAAEFFKDKKWQK